MLAMFSRISRMIQMYELWTLVDEWKHFSFAFTRAPTFTLNTLPLHSLVNHYHKIHARPPFPNWSFRYLSNSSEYVGGFITICCATLPYQYNILSYWFFIQSLFKETNYTWYNIQTSRKCVKIKFDESFVWHTLVVIVVTIPSSIFWWRHSTNLL